MDNNMGQNPLVSVIVPVYNVEKYVKECIRSIREQRYENLEIIVVNDASTDRTAVILDELAGAESRMRIIHLSENVGALSARSLGVSAARGDLVAFVDGDDFVHSEYLSCLVRALSRDAADIAMCGAARVAGERVVDEGFIKFTKPLVVRENLLGEFCKNRFGTGVLWNKLYKRACIDAAFSKEIDPELRNGEDYVLNLVAFQMANSVTVIPETLYYYRLREGSISRAGQATGFSCTLRAYVTALECFSTEAEDARHSIDELYARLLRYYKVSLDHGDVFAEVRDELASSLLRLGIARPEALHALLHFQNPDIRPSGFVRLVDAGLERVIRVLKGK
jgi:glycosyltransferase involved in cell wall biosynthesis